MSDRLGRVDIHYAALSDNVEALKRIQKSGVDLDVQDNNGFTPLHFAAQQSATEAGLALITWGARVDVPNRFGNTPLIVAVLNFRGDPSLVPMLLNHGADPHWENNYGNSPTSIAKQIANYDVAKYFLNL
jgi:ankyrin repeat protein